MKKDANFGIGFGKSEPGFTVNFGSEPQTGGLVRIEYVHPGARGTSIRTRFANTTRQAL
jgi:hypothetical protein